MDTSAGSKMPFMTEALPGDCSQHHVLQGFERLRRVLALSTLGHPGASTGLHRLEFNESFGSDSTLDGVEDTSERSRTVMLSAFLVREDDTKQTVRFEAVLLDPVASRSGTRVAGATGYTVALNEATDLLVSASRDVQVTTGEVAAHV